jgi:hypothetical protein
MIDSIPNNMHTTIYSLQRFKQRCMENTTGGLDSIAYCDTISCCSNHRFHRRCSLSPVHRFALSDETRSLRTPQPSIQSVIRAILYDHLMWLRKGHQVAGELYTISPMKRLCLPTIYSVASRERHVEREVYL